MDFISLDSLVRDYFSRPTYDSPSQHTVTLNSYNWCHGRCRPSLMFTIPRFSSVTQPRPQSVVWTHPQLVPLPRPRRCPSMEHARWPDFREDPIFCSAVDDYMQLLDQAPSLPTSYQHNPVTLTRSCPT